MIHPSKVHTAIATTSLNAQTVKDHSDAGPDILPVLGNITSINGILIFVTTQKMWAKVWCMQNSSKIRGDCHDYFSCYNGNGIAYRCADGFFFNEDNKFATTGNRIAAPIQTIYATAEFIYRPLIDQQSSVLRTVSVNTAVAGQWTLPKTFILTKPIKCIPFLKK
jgi:hypothetical protein